MPWPGNVQLLRECLQLLARHHREKRDVQVSQNDPLPKGSLSSLGALSFLVSHDPSARGCSEWADDPYGFQRLAKVIGSILFVGELREKRGRWPFFVDERAKVL